VEKTALLTIAELILCKSFATNSLSVFFKVPDKAYIFNLFDLEFFMKMVLFCLYSIEGTFISS
jgi:hypothetical protein